MAKTLTITLLSGSTENEDAIMVLKLAHAVLEQGDKVNIFYLDNQKSIINSFQTP